MKIGEFSYPAIEEVVFGRPAEKVVREKVQSAGHQRAFLLSSRSLAAQGEGPLQRVMRGLGELHAGSFSAVAAHTPREDVLAAANAARAAKADVLVAVGGGSVIDATKAVQMCLWMNIRDVAGFDRFRQVSGRPSDSAIVPPAAAIRAISVSTTLSAAEFNSIAGVTDCLTRTKEAFSHRLFVPRVVVLDPASTLDTPPRLLRATAIRSFDHAIESYCSPLANPATEAQSLQGLRLLAQAMRQMPGAPGDLHMAMNAQFGMWLAISAAVSGVPTGASHGIGYALGASFGVPHGETSCVMLPAVLEWNASHDVFGQSEIAAALDCPGEAPGPALRALVSRLGLPSRLRDVGVTRAQFGELADRALGYTQLSSNRVPVTTREQVTQILELAF